MGVLQKFGRHQTGIVTCNFVKQSEDEKQKSYTEITQTPKAFDWKFDIV